jgi:hypothetical protein
MKHILIIVILLFVLLNCKSQQLTMQNSDASLTGNYKTPSTHVVSKFKQFNYVFLGEQPKIKHNADFMAKP